jgi:hypothetical protein
MPTNAPFGPSGTPRALLVASALLLTACAARQRRVVADTPANGTALPFPWWPGEIRPIVVTPLRYDGQPTPCGTPEGTRPCDIEVTDAGEVYYRSRTAAPAGEIGPGLALGRDGTIEFSLDESGALIGHGLFHAPDTAQVMFCEMTAEPALHCGHDFSAAAGTPIWNEGNCKGSLVLRVDGGEIVAAFPEYPGETSIAARVEPAPDTDGAEALALFLYAMELVEGDTQYHTPYVSDMHGRR